MSKQTFLTLSIIALMAANVIVIVKLKNLSDKVNPTIDRINKDLNTLGL